MKQISKCLTALLLLWNTYTGIQAQVSHAISVEIKPSYVLPTSPFFRGENNSQKAIDQALSGHLKYGFKFPADSRLGRLYPYAVQGIGVGYNTFYNSKEIGNPLAIYAFQSSKIANISHALTLDYEWNFGASFGWQKYDPENNPMNHVVGSRINAYINLEFLLNWHIDSNTSLRAGIGITHYSNGNTNYPNSGVNTLGASVGIMRYFNPKPKGIRKTYIADEASFDRHVTYDLIVYGSTKRKGVYPENDEPFLASGSFGIFGLNFNPLYNINKYFRTGFSLDMQYDESANIVNHMAKNDDAASGEDIKFYRPSFREQFGVGLSARAEIVMPIFCINIGVGKNFICKGDDTNSFYQIFVLKTNITKSLFIHTGYQLYRFKEPNNLMLGIGYRFNSGSK